MLAFKKSHLAFDLGYVSKKRGTFCAPFGIAVILFLLARPTYWSWAKTKLQEDIKIYLRFLEQSTAY